MADLSPAIGLVAGSGIDLIPLLDSIISERHFRDFDGLPPAQVEGHAGKFYRGHCGDIPVVVQQGRLHVYEGHPPALAARTVDTLHQMGVRTIAFTNVVGGLLPEMEPGDLASPHTVHLWPYTPWTQHPQNVPTDFIVPGCKFSGIYIWMHGPCYETQAEIRALQVLDGAVVGMSAGPELHRCRELGIRAAVLSCVTNSCTSPAKLTHDHVVKTAREAAHKIVATLRDALPAFVHAGPPHP